MKTTIDIADELFEQVQRLARKERTTFRALAETGLRLLLKNGRPRKKKLPPLPVVKGQGLTPEFKDATWEQIRDAIYPPPRL